MADVKLHRFAASARSFLSRGEVFGGTALAALLIIAAVIAVLEPQFFTPSNLLNIGRQASVLVIVACGMTMVILAGAIDLSVGSAIALCSVVGASLATNVGLSTPLTIAMMIGLGAVIGAVKGALIAWSGINSFIVTLGMMTVLRGMADSSASASWVEFRCRLSSRRSYLFWSRSFSQRPCSDDTSMRSAAMRLRRISLEFR
jgi:ribose/xylose/arabinose/galactoside ABC-type transport system permease subunit